MPNNFISLLFKNTVMKTRDIHGTIIFLALFLVVGILVVSLKPSITGSVTYVSLSKEWDFSDSSSLFFNDTLVNISGGSARLSIITVSSLVPGVTTNTSVISSASKVEEDESEDVFDDIRVKDGEDVNIGKDDLLNISFSHSLQSGDNVSFYVDANKAGKIRICLNGSCSSPGYGEVSHGGYEGWLSISLAGLQSPVSVFFIDTDSPVKFDYIYSNYSDSFEYVSLSSSFPSTAEIQTADVSPSDFYKWDQFSHSESLAGHSVEYSYSTDSGETWIVFGGGDISGVNSSRIRFKAVLNSDGYHTPVIGSMSVNFSGISCTEDWQAAYRNCMSNDFKLKYYVDANDCGTGSGLPSDNGTYIYCDYCTPSWFEVNGSCGSGDRVGSYFVDLNACYQVTGLVSDNLPPENNSYACDYCSPLWVEFNGSCRNNDSLSSYFFDTKGCYLVTGMDSDSLSPENNTYSCDYCLPNISFFNTPCGIDDVRVMWANDSNGCFGKTGLQADSIPANVSFKCDFCMPEWSCSSFSACLSNSVEHCLSVNDSNKCFAMTGLENDSFNGNISYFDLTCSYDGSPPTVLSYSTVNNGSSLLVNANLSDSSGISSVYVNISNEKSNAAYNPSVINGSSYFFDLNLSAFDRGLYRLSLFSADDNNNSGVVALSPFVHSSNSSIFSDSSAGLKHVVLNASFGFAELNFSSNMTDQVYVAFFRENIKNSSPAALSAGVFVDVLPPNEPESLKLRLFYNESYIAGRNINESTLSIYFYNSTSAIWIRLSSDVNLSGNYVEAIVGHASYYGLFGTEVQRNDSIVFSKSDSEENAIDENIEGENDGLSGDLLNNTLEQANIGGPAIETEEKVFVNPDINPVGACNYSVHMGGLDNVSLIAGRNYSASMNSIGTCDIYEVEVSLDSSLVSIFAITYDRRLPSSIVISKKDLNQKTPLIVAFAVKSEKEIKNYNGSMKVRGIADGRVVFEESFPFVAEVEQVRSSFNGSSAFIYIVVFSVFVGILVFIVKKGRSMRPDQL